MDNSLILDNNWDYSEMEDFSSVTAQDMFVLSKFTELKKKYVHIRRIYVRAEFPYIDDSYKAYLSKKYDETYYPERLLSAGRAVYVERNYEMVDNSRYCICYYDENYVPDGRNSGTKIAYDYASKKDLQILNCFNIRESDI